MRLTALAALFALAACGSDTDISDGGTLDLVVLDNLIHGEPKKAF